ncbi:acyl-ACP desaturase [Nocardia stercoris]|uniref:Acyl-ACP desaturase n=2 Tax=Nocardia stercoris TaxID=2483361 RepID=A0A3M2LDV4_9NOCA|nr:acyl-ACP desaturase [Nocardia stercoris]
MEDILARHLRIARPWYPHDYVPWSDGRNFALLGGEDWDPAQSELTELTSTALTVSVLIADNLSAYHRDLAKYLRHGPWWRWVGRWTAEENRHEILLRNYLVVSRAVDPIELERMRMTQVVAGLRRPSVHVLDVLARAAFDEAAATVRHRNTAALAENSVVTAIADRLAADDAAHTEVFADLVAAGLNRAPDQAVRAIADQVAVFETPEVTLADGCSGTALLAASGVYEPVRAPEVVFGPLVDRWKIFSRTDFGSAGEQAAAELAVLLGR